MSKGNLTRQGKGWIWKKRNTEDFFDSLIPMSRQCPGSRVSAEIVVSLGDKYHNNICPPSFSSLLAFISEQMLNGMECPFGQLGAYFLAVTLPKVLPTPALLGEGGLAGILERWPRCCGSTALQDQNTAVLSNLSRHQCNAQTCEVSCGLSQSQYTIQTKCIHLGFLPMLATTPGEPKLGLDGYNSEKNLM